MKQICGSDIVPLMLSTFFSLHTTQTQIFPENKNILYYPLIPFIPACLETVYLKQTGKGLPMML